MERYFEDESELRVVKIEFAIFSGGRFPSLDAKVPFDQKVPIK